MQPRIVIIAHCFYSTLWDGLLHCIRNFENYNPTIYITTTDATFSSYLRTCLPEAHIEVVSNCGYDIAPFLYVLNKIDLSKYDFIVKLHTKRDCDDWINCIPTFGSAWRNRLLSFCKTENQLRVVLKKFNTSKVGMVAHGSLIVGKPDHYWESKACRDVAYNEIALLGLNTSQLTEPEFVAGTMFIARSSLFKILQHKIDLSRFSSEMSHQTGTLAHSFERVLGFIVACQGYYIADFTKIRPFLIGTEFIRIPLFRLMRWTKRAFQKQCRCIWHML